MIIEWPLSNSDLNPIENQWPIVKKKLYEDSKRYNCKQDIREAIKTIMSVNESVEVKNITKLISNRQWDGRSLYQNVKDLKS